MEAGRFKVSVFLLYRLAAVQCGSPPLALNSMQDDSGQHNYTSSITITCPYGFWLSRGRYNHTMSCSAEGGWEPPPPAVECSGKLNFGLDFKKIYQKVDRNQKVKK